MSHALAPDLAPAKAGIPVFVCNLDASRAREVCDAHDYLVEKSRDHRASISRCGYWPGAYQTLNKIDHALAQVDAVILDEVDADSVFGRVHPVLWAIYATR